jgi:DNA processing protein
MNIKMQEINFTGVNDQPYLLRLREYAAAPSHLYYKGRLPTGPHPSVAIVGSRRPTHYGKEVTYDLAYKLAQRGVIIISGLALGIDAIAHRAALDAGGRTIAILAGGLDSIYPRTNTNLAKEILDKGGALISEYPEQTPSQPFQFLARNRIVSGLADAVVVTEAAARSGTLSTIMHALDQGKEVFAVPGPITSLLSVGPNRLLQQGAHPVLSADDIFTVITPDGKRGTQQSILGTTPVEQSIIELIYSGIRDGEELQKKTKQGTSDFLTALTGLEIKGIIRSTDGNRWTLT